MDAVKRRFLTAGLGAASAGVFAPALIGRAFAQSGDVDLNYEADIDAYAALGADEQEELFIADAEPGEFKPGSAQFLGLPGVREEFLQPRELFLQLTSAVIAAADKGEFVFSWADDGVSTDYRNFNEGVDFAFFRIDHQTLERAAARNNFALDDDVVLFGVRGCRLLPSTPDVAFARERYPNHQEPRCVLGIWKRSEQKVLAVQGSTVPNGAYIFLQRKFRAQKNMSNLMPTGLHEYAVGPHRASSNYPQPGAWRQIKPFAVLRAYGNSGGNVAFSEAEHWDLRGSLVFDNIHAAIYDLRPKEGLYYFSSAGCQTIPGGYTRTERIPERNWALYRELAGLTTPARYGSGWTTPDDGRRFKYMLLTGRDLRLAARDHGEMREHHRLRYGSEGEAVRRLQEALRLSGPDGKFGPNTQINYIRWQIENLGSADAIVTPKIARDHFGFDL